MATDNPQAIAKYRGSLGVDSSKPSNLIDSNAAEFINNFILKNSEIRTRPVFNPVNSTRVNKAAGIAPGNDGNPDVLTNNGYIKILDVQEDAGTGTPYAYLIDNKSAWVWKPSTQVWTKAADLTELVGSGIPITSIGINGFNYFCSLTTGKLYQLNTVTQTLTKVSDIAGGIFLGELSQQLILASTVETGTFFHQRVRWSATGDPTQLDPAMGNLTAGFNDLLDVPDLITGFQTIGKTGYIFRSNGITEMIPTGTGSNPYDFVHISSANNAGIGAFYPLATDSWGTYCCFISQDDIYLISSSGIQSIGARARDAIFADIATWSNNMNFCMSSSPNLDIIGSIIPMIRRSYTYAMYIIAIPFFNPAVNGNVAGTGGSANSTIFWIYSIEEQTWTRWVSSQGVVTSKLNIACIPNASSQSPESLQFLFIPQFRNTGVPYVGYTTIDTTPVVNAFQSFNTEEDCEYRYRVEEIDTDKKATVQRLRVLYRNLGKVKTTFTVTVADGRSVSDTLILGDDTADGRIKIARPSTLITGELPQVKITRKAGDGPLSIIGLDIVAPWEEGETI